VGILDETRFVERSQFFNGQRLFDTDLQALEGFNREMRWLHNRSLHQPGVGKGLAITSEKDGREVSIGPGYALDSRGREIVLTQTFVQPIPPVASERDGKSVFYDLVISYPEDSALKEAETREGICLPRGVVRLREEPIFCWVRLERDPAGLLKAVDSQLAEDVSAGLRIMLARIEVLNCKLVGPASVAQRREAGVSRLPYVACGEVSPADWRPWNGYLPQTGGTLERLLGSGVVDGLLFVLLADIDTSVAGFQTVPCYSAQVVGPRLLEVTIENENKQSMPVSILVLDQLHVQDPQPDRFTAFLLCWVLFLGSSIVVDELRDLDGGDSAEASTPRSAAAGVQVPVMQQAVEEIIKKWGVTWIGVES
jgi:hypothetical protein